MGNYKIKNCNGIYNNRSFVLLEDSPIRYGIGNKRVGVGIKKNEILKDLKLVKGLKNKGYHKMSYDSLEVPIEINLIENIEKEVIWFIRDIKTKDVEELYCIHLSIEIKGKEINRFYRYCLLDRPFTDLPYLGFVNTIDEVYRPGVYTEEKGKLFGDPVDPQKNVRSIFGERERVDMPQEYKVHLNDVDKFIATKVYYNTDAIGSENEEKHTLPTGKEERIVLDMRNFDEKVYKYFLDHKILQFEWEEDTMNQKFNQYVEKERLRPFLE
ncbi:hypothetical protein [Persicobacter psychrovividus]|uniref:Uncharacterized protein n=1 Tax=Persicobacter psychrovividus TaxID=387638 RepID=A0ABN6L6L6_9BACT|nr:hypothetical protein PEPS_11350 [Persicobacter psychrovividus]